MRATRFPTPHHYPEGDGRVGRGRGRMIRMLKLGLAAVLGSLCGCAGPAMGPFQGYLAAPDPFRPGVEHRFCDPVTIADHIAIALNHRRAGEDPGAWTLRTSWVGDEWLFVQGAQLLLDGAPWTVSPMDPPRREVLSGSLVRVREVNDFSLDAPARGRHRPCEDNDDTPVANLAWFVGWVREKTAPAAGPEPPSIATSRLQ